MFDRYTESAKRVIFFGRYEASRYGSPEMGVTLERARDKVS
jgi:hypothetical protein